MNLKIYFDGACGPVNPGGTASYGFVLTDATGTFLDSGHGVIGSGPGMTNNLAEHYALIQGFEAFIKYVNNAKLTKCNLSVFGDSQLVIRQMSGIWKVKDGHAYTQFAKMAQALRDRIRKARVNVSFTWIPREENTICDELSKKDQNRY